jgi:hypothetical protein
MLLPIAVRTLHTNQTAATSFRIDFDCHGASPTQEVKQNPLVILFLSP